MSIKNFYFIINPSSGKDEPILPILNDVMQGKDIKWEVMITKEAGDGFKLAKEAIAKGANAIASYGGDGTLMEVMSGMIGSEVALAILPGGTANVMSKELGIPQTLKEALQFIVDGKWDVRKVDVGQLDKRFFILRASLGFEAQMVKGADAESKSKLGVFAYFLSALSALKKLQPARYVITVDGVKNVVHGITCIVANSGSMGIAGNISLDKNIDVSDGLLDVLVVRRVNLRLFGHILAMFLKHERSDNIKLVKHWQGKSVRVTSWPAQVVQCDGEILKIKELNTSVVPSAIKIFVPQAQEIKAEIILQK